MSITSLTRAGVGGDAMVPIDRPLLASFRRLFGFARQVGAPLGRRLERWLLLATRLWLAQAFLVLQVSMLMSGTGLTAALSGGFWEAGTRAVFASGFGGAIQALCPLLLALGLLTRPAAAAMILQVLLLHHAGERASLDALWIVLLVSLTILGPGTFSLDRWLGPGTANSAVPGMRAVAAFYAALTRRGTPLLLIGLRVLIALVVLVPHIAGGVPTPAPPMSLAMMVTHLPATPSAVATLSAPPAFLAAALLCAGLAVRPTAVALLLLAPFGAASSVADSSLYWILLIGLLLVRGGGPFALDRLASTRLPRVMSAPDPATLPHVVIVGGGFGGYAAARGLARSACRVTLLDKRNYFLFQPLLYQVATAGLSPADIATPIRAMLREQRNVRVLLGEVDDVDTGAKAVHVGAARIAYDTLVLATGAQHSYFGRDEWAAVAPGLKTIEDATAVRRRLLLAFEAAEGTADASARQAWLTFVVVGGGPTGVELAGAIAELARFGMAGEFQAIDPAAARVVLVQSAPRLLPTFPESLSREAAAALRRLGVEVLLEAKAEAIDTSGVTVSGVRLPARTILWAAGVTASPAARWLCADADRAGRVKVGPDLRVSGCGDVFAIGDTCAALAWHGDAVPGLAPAAKQAGAYVARVIDAGLRGRAPPPAFAYRHFGSLATIGRKSAVADFGRARCTGALAWWLWGAAHILFLIDGRNRAGVVLEWLWDYFTLRRGTRLILGAVRPAADDQA